MRSSPARSRFFATAGTIARAGARPLFCDIDPVTFNLSPAAVAEFLAQQCEQRERRAGATAAPGARVRALMPVHLYGQVADMARSMQIARRYGLKVIEDAAQAIGAADARQRAPAASATSAACRSFRPRTSAPSAMPACASPTMRRSPSAWRCCACTAASPSTTTRFIGGNFRIDELQAAVLNIKLRHLDDWSAGRQRNAAYYDAAFARARLGAAPYDAARRSRACATSTTST